jgi:hypothetical protein
MDAAYAWSDRRHFLKHLAGLSALALPGMQFLRGLQANASDLQKNNKSLIVLWLSGGPPTIDMWDLKPGEPTAGEFKPISTSAGGIQICELLPAVAKQMKHLSIVRALRTNEGDHNRGRVLMHTSRVPNPIVNYPSIGAVVSHELTPKSLALPGFISIGRPADGPGFLGMNYAPFTVQNPGQPPANLRPPETIGRDLEQMERVARRRRLFVSVEDRFTAEKHGEAAKSHSEIYDKAYRLIASPLGKVFNLGSERKSLVEEYGANGFGQGCLLARRLVEAGVTCVEIDLGGWDLHANAFPALKNQRLPMLNKGMGALVRDLTDRGMWKNTVLVCMGEFGRTPRINQNAGRDHWARCWSVVVGGGAIKGGQIFGATDKQGTDVKGEEVATVGDLFATIYKGLGLDPTQQIRDNLGRPLPIAEGKPIKALV